MKIVGIICEYNPMHLGHSKQIRMIRQQFGQDTAVVCLMSGNFVQRGMPAVFDKSLRAQAAVRSGADLVLELPVEYALSSAEGFAAGGVKILSGFCDVLSFGAETGDRELLMQTAILNSEAFLPHLSDEGNMRLIDWKRSSDGASPYTFTEEDYEMLMRSGKLWARKVSEQVDRRIIERIYETIDPRK